MQRQQPKQRDAWRRRREQYLRDSGRNVELIREGYMCEHPVKDWAVIVGRGERTALERQVAGAGLFVVGRELNVAQAGAKISHVGAKVRRKTRTCITTQGHREEVQQHEISGLNQA